MDFVHWYCFLIQLELFQKLLDLAKEVWSWSTSHCFLSWSLGFDGQSIQVICSITLSFSFWYSSWSHAFQLIDEWFQFSLWFLFLGLSLTLHLIATSLSPIIMIKSQDKDVYYLVQLTWDSRYSWIDYLDPLFLEWLGLRHLHQTLLWLFRLLE